MVTFALMMLCRIILLATALLYALGASAQTTRVRGRVTDAADGHPLQFASVVFPEPCAPKIRILPLFEVLSSPLDCA